jgi:hypothetical protein
MLTKKIVAREWLILLKLLAVGFLAIPYLISFADVGPDWWFYKALMNSRSPDFWGCWLVALGPYILVQLIRSIIWARDTASGD